MKTSKIWFTSDQHFGHVKVIQFCNRPFASVEEMNSELVRRHNALVNDEDIVYHLGDFSMKKADAFKYLPQLKGRHHLITGNHDGCHPVMCKSGEKLQRLRAEYTAAGFETIALQQEITLTGQLSVLMHHMPYLNHETAKFDTRYPLYRPVDRGQLLLHGHVHTSWKVNGRMINVGADQWSFAPVSLEEIVALIGAHAGGYLV